MLRQQLADLEHHLTSPVNGYRQGKHLQGHTWQGYINTLNSLFGVVHHLVGTSLGQLSLWDCACPNQLALFMTVQLQHKQVVKGTIAVQGSKLGQVISYLQLNTTTQPEADQLARLARWYHNIRGQVIDMGAAPRHVDLQQLPIE